MSTMPQMNEEKLNALGDTLFRRWGMYVSDRKMIEERWMRNLRQVRKIYDPEVLQNIPDDRSKAYPGLTQWIVRGTIARLMQMLWPGTEKNYAVQSSPMPDLSQDQLQQVLTDLQTAKAQGGDPAQVVLTDEEIEAAIKKFSDGKAARMELKIDDDLKEMDIITLARRVVKSAVTYNMGVLRGPLHTKTEARTWEKDANTGQYTAKTVEKRKPLFEAMSVWDHYPDMTATSLDKQDGSFDRHIMTRAEVEALAERPDFMKERILQFLRDHEGGNYKPQWWESVMKGEPKSGTAPVANRETRKFEALSWWGNVSGHDLAAAGVDMAGKDLGRSYFANAWLLGDVTVKLILAPLGQEVKHHHYFIFEEDDLTILGSGQCDVVRDSQMGLCESVRAILDNASVVGPMVEVNQDLLTPGEETSVRKHRTWHREGEGSAAQIPAVRNIEVSSHIPDLKVVSDMMLSFADRESGLPPPSVGDVSGGGSEALRTTQNASMFLGAAALPIRDTVRNYDTFTVSYIGALVAWNTKYDPNESRDGDHNVLARGSTSLIAKEVLARSLNEFRATISPEELPHVKIRGLLEQRIKVNDLPLDDILESEDVANETIARQTQQTDAVQQAQLRVVEAEAEERATNAMKNMALARKADGSIQVDVFTAVMDALAQAAKTRTETARATADGVKAAASVIAAKKPAAGAKKS